MVATGLVDTVVKFMFLASIRKVDFTKFLDLLRLAKGLALACDDEKSFELFDKELMGYSKKDKLPQYRTIKGVRIRESVADIIHYFDRFNNNMDRIIWFGETPIRLREFKFLLLNIENMIMNYKDGKLKEILSSGSAMLPEVDMSNMPELSEEEELEKMFGE